MNDVTVKEFGMTYPILNLELSKNEKEFERGIIAIHIAELNRGFIVKRINKTTKKELKLFIKPVKMEKKPIII